MNDSAYDRDAITAVVLAGGAGSRMQGADKGWLQWQGRFLIERVLERVAPQVGAVMISANRSPERYAKLGWPVIADTTSQLRGPLAGISAALQGLQSQLLLTVPVDAPLLPHDLAERLAAARQQAGKSVAVAHDGRRRQPLFALYDRGLAALVAIALASDDPSVTALQSAVGCVEVDFGDSPGAFLNLNTPGDLERRSADTRL